MPHCMMMSICIHTKGHCGKLLLNHCLYKSLIGTYRVLIAEFAKDILAASVSAAVMMMLIPCFIRNFRLYSSNPAPTGELDHLSLQNRYILLNHRRRNADALVSKTDILLAKNIEEAD